MSTRGNTPSTTDQPRETAAGLAVPGGKQTPDETPDTGVNPATQSELVEDSQPQDTLSPRAKNSRKGKVTAENANQ